jgi:GAF domain-containing protein
VTLQRVAQLAVPEFADLCIVDVLDGGELQRLATAHVRADKAPLLDELRRCYPAGAASPAPAARVLASGRLELLESVTPEVVARHTVDARHAELIRAIGIRSHLAMPLIARGAIIGVISLGITESERRYGQGDVGLAAELARRIAYAIDNARLYRQAQLELAERHRTVRLCMR